MLSFMMLEKTMNLRGIKQSRDRLRELNKRILTLGNGKKLAREVLH